MTVENQTLRLRLRTAVETGGSDARETSSVTDTDAYRTFCALAARNNLVFAAFRRHPIIIEVMEHVSLASGQELVSRALERHPTYNNLLSRFELNDEVGAPLREELPQIGLFAPTTLRYIKILADLESLFESLDGMHVVEIGGGYGGQARLIYSRFAPASVTLLDLPEVGALADRYLSAFGHKVIVNPQPEELAKQQIDLLISNYALSEIRSKERQAYVETVMLRAKRGFMLWNAPASDAPLLHRSGEHTVSDREIAALIPNARVETRQPWISRDDERLRNTLIVWGDVGRC
jgi:hypothetical protein